MTNGGEADDRALGHHRKNPSSLVVVLSTLSDSGLWFDNHDGIHVVGPKFGSHFLSGSNGRPRKNPLLERVWVEPPERIELTTFPYHALPHAPIGPGPASFRTFRSAAVGTGRALLATLWATPQSGKSSSQTSMPNTTKAPGRGSAASSVTKR